jgi:hypothetical protein
MLHLWIRLDFDTRCNEYTAGSSAATDMHKYHNHNVLVNHNGCTSHHSRER